MGTTMVHDRFAGVTASGTERVENLPAIKATRTKVTKLVDSLCERIAQHINQQTTRGLAVKEAEMVKEMKRLDAILDDAPDEHLTADRSFGDVSIGTWSETINAAMFLGYILEESEMDYEHSPTDTCVAEYLSGNYLFELKGRWREITGTPNHRDDHDGTREYRHKAPKIDQFHVRMMLATLQRRRDR